MSCKLSQVVGGADLRLPFSRLVCCRSVSLRPRRNRPVFVLNCSGVTESRDVHCYVSGTPQAGSRDVVTPLQRFISENFAIRKRFQQIFSQSCRVDFGIENATESSVEGSERSEESSEQGEGCS